MDSNTYLSAEALQALTETSNLLIEERQRKLACEQHAILSKKLPHRFAHVVMHGASEDELDTASFWLRDADLMPDSPHFQVMLIRAVVANKPDTAQALVGKWVKAAAEQYTQASCDKAIEALQ